MAETVGTSASMAGMERPGFVRPRQRSWASYWSRQARLNDDEDNYAADLAACAEEDFSDLDTIGFLKIDGQKDKMGRPVVSVVAKYYNPYIVSRERLYRYFITRCDRLTMSGYSLVWFHTESTYFRNCPSVAWLWWMYERLPERYRSNLQHVFVLHCDLSLWVSSMALCPWFSGLLWRKICWISRVEFLWDYIAKENFSLPDYVIEHDQVLEDQPLHDYGVVASKDLVRGMGPPGNF